MAQTLIKQGVAPFLYKKIEKTSKKVLTKQNKRAIINKSSGDGNNWKANHKKVVDNNEIMW